MPAELDRDACRLCGDALRSWELDHRLCSVCEEYAQQLGVRNEAQLEQVVVELLNDPLFRHARG